MSSVINLSNPKRQDNRVQNISSVINLSNPKRQDNRVQYISNVINLSNPSPRKITYLISFSKYIFKNFGKLISTLNS